LLSIIRAFAKINFLDTARDYGDSEKKIGDYQRRYPNRFTVATKLASMSREISLEKERMAHFLENSIQESRKALASSTSLLFLHQTDEYVSKNPLFWEAVKKLKKQNPFVKFGISVYDSESTQEISKHGEDIDCVQAPYNVLDRRFEVLAKIFQEKGIVFISRSTFLKGALVENKIPVELKGLERVRKNLQDISKKAAMSVPQLLIRFVLSSPLVDCVLIGARSVEQLRENVDFSKFNEEFGKCRQQLLEISVEDPFLSDPRQWRNL
jgi:aryl-alcohol dehydrogenase-like predicted oxidoreductase